MEFVWIDPNFVDLYPNSIQTGGVVQFFALAHFIPSMSSSLEPASYFLIYKFEGDFQLEWDILWFSTKMRHFEERNSDEMCFRGNVGQIQPTKETSLETSHLTLKLSQWTSAHYMTVWAHNLRLFEYSEILKTLSVCLFEEKTIFLGNDVDSLHYICIWIFLFCCQKLCQGERKKRVVL